VTGRILAVFMLVALAAQAQPPMPTTIAPRSLSGGRFGDGEPSLLPIADEQVVERARNLVRAGYADQGRQLLDDVQARHPDDLDVLLARAEFLMRMEPGLPVARFLEEQARRSPVAKSLAARPRRAGFWLRYQAEALSAAGRDDEAVAKAKEAWERSPEQGSWARVRLEAWSEAKPDAVAKDLAKLADRHPTRADFQVEAARADASAGRVRAAIQRLRKFELAGAKAAPEPSDDDGGPAPVGSHLWRLALALAARGEDGVDAADSVFIELALSDAYDPDVRRAATARLFDERVAAGQETSWFEGPSPGGTVRLQIGEGGRIETMTSDAPQKKSTKPPVDEATRSRNRLAALERVWLKLEPSSGTVRTGLELSERWRALGDEASARRVADQAAKLAPKAPGASDDPELTGRLAVRAGEAALSRGDLAAAEASFRQAQGSGASEKVREEAQYLACEVAFYEGRFDSAAAGYDAFARAYPTSRFTNDALERMYLIEAGEGAPVAGLPELAKAFRLARAGASDEALAASEAAEQRAKGGPAWSHAGLLTASLLVARGRVADGAARALAVAEGVPDDRLAPVARRKAGDAYRASGSDALALAQYEELLVRYPRSWLAPETRRLVQELRAKAGNTP
jgi:TolA-binding protein